MPALTAVATSILERMEPNRSYGPDDLRAYVPGGSIERLREIMHELWVNRQVERIGYSGWRRHDSVSAHTPTTASPTAQTVKPEELFDHATFSDFFK